MLSIITRRRVLKEGEESSGIALHRREGAGAPCSTGSPSTKASSVSMSINLEWCRPPRRSWFGVADVYSDVGVRQQGDNVFDFGHGEVSRGSV